jgi:hypothetical protein
MRFGPAANPPVGGVSRSGNTARADAPNSFHACPE